MIKSRIVAACKYRNILPRTLSINCQVSPFNFSFPALTLAQPYNRFPTIFKHFYSFSTDDPQKTSLYLIRQICSELLEIDSLILDRLSLVFGTHFISFQKFRKEDDAINNKKKVIDLLQEEKGDEKIALNAQQIYNNLQRVFEFLSRSKVGFLRGDLHTLTFYQLHKDIDQKLQLKETEHKIREIQYSNEDFKELLYRVTDPHQFRLPFKGIYKRQLESKVNLYLRQLLLEQVTSDQSHLDFEEVLDSLIKLNKVQQVDVVRRFMTEWVVPFTNALKQEQVKCMGKDLNSHRKIYGEYLIRINPQKIATASLAQLIVCIFQQIYKQGSIDGFQLQLFDGVQQKKYLSRVLRSIESQIAYQRQQKLFKECQRQYDKIIKAQNLIGKNKKVTEEATLAASTANTQVKDDKKANPKHWKSQSFKAKEKSLPYKYVPALMRKDFIENLKKKMNKFRSKNVSIPQKAKNQLGQLLVYIMKEVLTIDNKYGYKVPFITSEHKSSKKKKEFVNVSILRINQHFLTTIIPKLEKTEDIFIHMQRSLPTIIEPLPWMDPEIGGYYSQATTIMKYSHCPVQERVLKYADNNRAFEVLNFLSRTKWKINKEVLNIVEQIWREGGQESCIPKRYSQMLNTYRNSLKMQTDYRRRKDLNRKIQSIRDEISLRGDFNLKLSISRAFSKIDYFYFPHNFDFRGRVYPIPPHFNHIGNDLVRGLLLFGVGLPLGSNGIRWLKIHTANLMGKDKAPIDDKLKFIEENIEKIHQIAAQPLKNREWLQFQDCWQAIASIIDLSAALKSPKPQQYVSYLHVHQDGSCNGLQHYAALGRDLEGAYQVNLGPAPKPSDIYTHVSKMVIKMIEADLEGQPAGHHDIARKLLGNIKRKTIKQTVMTSVYGVTFIGAREQIYRQLRDQDFMSQQQNYAASIYVAKLTLLAISILFLGAHGIKEWFRKCASIVSKTGNPVAWITPLGLPVVQPYRKLSRFDTIKTLGYNMNIPQQVEHIPVNTIKQASAFPPNYVHSLDSSHMMYTAEVCREKGLSFAAVHDSYWTHAASVDRMNVILRQQFIGLHSQPLLQNFYQSLCDRFPQLDFPVIPKRGEFDLQNIKDSQYFFS